MCFCSKWISFPWWPVIEAIWIKHGWIFSVQVFFLALHFLVVRYEKLKPSSMRFCHKAASNQPLLDFLGRLQRLLSHSLWLWREQIRLGQPLIGTVFAFLPDPVSGWRRDIDDQSPRQLLHLHSEQQGRVGHLLKLLPNELILCRPLEILGFSYFVHKSQNLLSGLSSPSPAKNGRGLEGQDSELLLYDAKTHSNSDDES